MSDALKQFTTLLGSLRREREELQTRLNAIDAALRAAGDSSIPLSGPGQASRGRPTGKSRGPQKRNKVSVRHAVIDLTKSKPLSKEEIVEALTQAGMKFKVTSLAPLLYNKKVFRRADGKFQAI